MEEIYAGLKVLSLKQQNQALQACCIKEAIKTKAFELTLLTKSIGMSHIRNLN